MPMKFRRFKPTMGIHECYSPPDGNATVDIVAVHGLNGDAVKTWTSEKRKICWLSHPEFLPKHLKTARILSYGYNAHVSSLWGIQPTSDRIKGHAIKLVAQLYADRSVRLLICKKRAGLGNATRRPIIFICHSLGGIVVKRALAHSERQIYPQVLYLRSIFTHTHAVLFFGTPHSGSNKARLLLNLQNSIRLSISERIIQVESALVNSLIEGSEVLQETSVEFKPLIPEFSIYFFWEMKKTYFGYKRDYIVEKSSAAPTIEGTISMGIASDHRGMVRFENSESGDFKKIVKILKECVATASQRVFLHENSSETSLSSSEGYGPIQQTIETVAGTPKPSIPWTWEMERSGSRDNDLSYRTLKASIDLSVSSKPAENNILRKDRSGLSYRTWMEVADPPLQRRSAACRGWLSAVIVLMLLGINVFIVHRVTVYTHIQMTLISE
ncbi:hypothetical protein PRK78_001198 [Emydomyces testavorans]|uniref:DUF676 domain-containing protein n=1 Tax=Emydomyces testavorans TaxID=2070801 RepID=A0AAF0IF94_9EURO|nr:hypothetical protein PRK78_001198 [Emydomyces testavorans]